MSNSSKLEEAIQEYARAEGWQEYITGWTVLITFIDQDERGGRSGIAWLLPNGEMPWVQLLGMIEAARLKLHADFLEEE